MKNPIKEEQRRQRLQQLIEERCGGVIAEFARRIKIDTTYAGRMLYPAGKRGRKGISVHNIDLIETTFGLPKGWLDGIEPPDPRLAEITQLWASLPEYKRLVALRVVRTLSEPDDDGTEGRSPAEKKPTSDSPRVFLSLAVRRDAAAHKRDAQERRQAERRMANRRQVSSY